MAPHKVTCADLVVFGYMVHSSGAIVSWQNVGDYSGGFHLVEIPEDAVTQSRRMQRMAEESKQPKTAASLMGDPTLNPEREFAVVVPGIGSIGFQVRTLELVLNDASLIDEICGAGTYDRVVGPVERAILATVRRLQSVLVGVGNAGA